MLLPDIPTRNILDSLDGMRFRLNRLFYDTPNYSHNHSSTINHPPINVWTSEDKVVVHVLAPGVSIEDIDLQISEQSLLMQFKRVSEEEGRLRQERWQTESTRTIQLPFRVEADEAEAKLSEGLLVVELPRSTSDRPRKISVSS